MRNVVSLSDVPQDLHLWLKAEAKRQSAEQGVKVKLYQVVVQALQRFRRDVDNCRNNGIPVNEVTLGFQLPGQAVPKQHPRIGLPVFPERWPRSLYRCSVRPCGRSRPRRRRPSET